MWLVFKLLSKDGNCVEYAYSRESHDYDGIVRYYPASEEWDIEPCTMDKGHNIAIDNVGEMLCRLIDEGCPAKRYFAFG